MVISKDAVWFVRGFCNVPEGYEHAVTRFDMKKCLVYMDDVLIFRRTLEEHNERLEELLQRFSEAVVFKVFD